MTIFATQHVRRMIVGLLAACAALTGCTSTSTSLRPAPSSARSTSPPVRPTQATRARQPISAAKRTFPPRTYAQLQEFGDSGTASAITTIRSLTRPFDGCTRPNFYAVAPHGVGGRKLAADAVAYMQQHGALGIARTSCGAFLYLFKSAHQQTGDGYTDGAVIIDDHTVEVHTGDITSGPLFTVNT